jgi:tetratricopeptide (TPR) repeat protein
LSLEQYVLHRLGAERAMLESVVGRLRFATALVTYNGRRFDWPLLETRLRLQRLAAPWDEPPHLDLLPTGRRLWRGLLGTARLAAIESDILGVCRERDIPGSEIPARYVSFLRTGRAEMLDVIVDHNREDLLTLLAVHAVEARIAAGEAPPVDVDLAGYGRHLERLERWEEALAAYCGAIEGIHERRARQLAAVRAGTLLRRLGRHEESLAIWLSAAERGILPPSDALQRAAVVADRWLRDPGLALDLVDRALRHLDRRALLGVQPAAVDRDPRGRLDSMRRRLASRVRAPGNGTQVAFSPGR